MKALTIILLTVLLLVSIVALTSYSATYNAKVVANYSSYCITEDGTKVYHDLTIKPYETISYGTIFNISIENK